MHQTFGKQITSTAYVPVAVAEAPGPPEFGPEGQFNGSREQTKRARKPVTWTVIFGAAGAGSSSNSGLRVRITAILGASQVREITLDDLGRRWSGRAISIKIEAQLVTSGQTIEFFGAYGYSESDNDSPSSLLVSNLLPGKTISRSQASTDSALTSTALVNALQRETRRIMATADALSASTTEPYQIVLFGRRFVDQAVIRLGSLVIDNNNSDAFVRELVPGHFDQIRYQLLGTLASETASATLYIEEDLGSE